MTTRLPLPTAPFTVATPCAGAAHSASEQVKQRTCICMYVRTRAARDSALEEAPLSFLLSFRHRCSSPVAPEAKHGSIGDLTSFGFVLALGALLQCFLSATFPCSAQKECMFCSDFLERLVVHSAEKLCQLRWRDGEGTSPKAGQQRSSLRQRSTIQKHTGGATKSSMCRDSYEPGLMVAQKRRRFRGRSARRDRRLRLRGLGRRPEPRT